MEQDNIEGLEEFNEMFGPSTLNDVLDADEIASIAATRGIMPEEAGRLQWTGEEE